MNFSDELGVNVNKADHEAAEKTRQNWNKVCKPLGSLGLLEEYVIKLAGIFGTDDFVLDKRCAVIVCSDNGVVCEGVTQSDKDVTLAVAKSIADKIANINVMSEVSHIDTYVVDVGIDGITGDDRIIDMKVDYGTKDIVKGPAMTRSQAVEGIKNGIEIVRRMKEKGYKIVTTGEMGIGNTTTSSAIASVILEMDAECVTGRGAGLTSEGLGRKIKAINKAIKINKPDKNDAIDIISKIGGYDIAAMTGMFIGGAIYHIPVVIDGFISSVSALLAVMMFPETVDFMFASHVSEEPAGSYIMEKLGLEPIIHGHMRLGEGTGAVCLIPIIDIACNEYRKAYRFGDADIEQYEELK